MMRAARSALTQFTPRHDAFIGVDSDGCVFDTMALKQKRCFHGLIASHWHLQAIEQPLRETAEFVNLYSRWRGQNRFLALLQLFDLLPTHPAVRAAGAAVPALNALRAYVARGGALSESAIQQAADKARDAELHDLLAWSRAVNAAIAATVHHVPPFPWARRSLELMQANADVICVSQTPTEALVREWRENGMEHLLALIAGQELGTKAEHLALATRGRYAADRVLMIGDALGDLKAAEANHALFYPINPTGEDAAWQRFHTEAYARFLGGTFRGAYQEALVAEFLALLPEHPRWQGG